MILLKDEGCLGVRDFATLPNSVPIYICNDSILATWIKERYIKNLA